MNLRALSKALPIVGIAWAACTPSGSATPSWFSLSAGSGNHGAGQCFNDGSGSPQDFQPTAQAQRAYLLVQKQFDTITETKLSAAGSAATQYAADAPTTPVRGAILRYGDQQVFGLDYASQTFIQQSVDALTQQRLARTAKFSTINFPGMPAPYNTPAVPQSSTLERLPSAPSIAGLDVEAYLVHDATGRIWRVSYASTLPVPPAEIQKKVAEINPPIVAAHSQNDNVDNQPLAERLAGRPLLRSEVQTDSGWSVVFDTTSATVLGAVSCSTYSAPPGWLSKSPPALPTGNGGSIGNSGECGGAAHQIPADPIYGGGPQMFAPQVYVFFWGTAFSDPNNSYAVGQIGAAINEALTNPSYTNPLSQSYGGVGVGGQIVSTHFVDADPRTGILPGTDNNAGTDMLDVPSFVINEGLHGNGPLIWWEQGANPLYVIVVPYDQNNLKGGPVDVSSSLGYHFMVPTAATFTVDLIPFPFNFFVNAGMPYAIGAVPLQGLSLPDEGLLFRDVCDQNSPSTCLTIASFDNGTTTVTHEYVEAVADPYPFFGYSDPLKQPAGECNEIGDICQFALPTYGEEARLGNFVVASYWANSTGTCVPAMQPTISILAPADGAQIPFQTGGAVVSATATATDPVMGDLRATAAIAWYLDGSTTKLTQTGGSITLPPLQPGPHTVKAQLVDLDKLEVDAQVTFTVTAPTLSVTINNPTSGSTWAADQTIVVKGSAFDSADGTLTNSIIWTEGEFNRFGTGTGFTVTGLAQGSHTWIASVTDSAQITQTASVTFTVGPPSGLPFIQIAQPSDAGLDCQNPGGGDFSAPATVTFSANAHDSSGNAVPDRDIVWTATALPDGPPVTLGTGNTLLDVVLDAPGGCGAITTYKITATVTVSGKSSSDYIYICVGTIC